MLIPSRIGVSLRGKLDTGADLSVIPGVVVATARLNNLAAMEGAVQGAMGETVTPVVARRAAAIAVVLSLGVAGSGCLHPRPAAVFAETPVYTTAPAGVAESGEQAAKPLLIRPARLPYLGEGAVPLKGLETALVHQSRQKNLLPPDRRRAEYVARLLEEFVWALREAKVELRPNNRVRLDRLSAVAPEEAFMIARPDLREGDVTAVLRIIADGLWLIEIVQVNLVTPGGSIGNGIALRVVASGKLDDVRALLLRTHPRTLSFVWRWPCESTKALAENTRVEVSADFSNPLATVQPIADPSDVSTPTSH